MNQVVAVFLENSYRPGLKKLLELIPTTSHRPGERGYLAEVARVINLRVAPYGLKIHQQYISDWYNGNKIIKGGLDIQAIVGLGIGAGFSNDLKISYAMTQLLLAGVWNPQTLAPHKLEALIADGFAVTTTSEQLTNVESAISAIAAALVPTPASPQQLLASKLQSIVGEGYENRLTNVFSAARSQRLIEVIEGVGAPLDRSEWQVLAVALNELTDDDTWNYEQIRAMLEALKKANHSKRRHQASARQPA